MIIDSTYFKGDIYIPAAKPSINSVTKGVSVELQYFIDEYERDCLIKCLGFTLYKEFEAQLDPNETNGLKVGAASKWDDLLNGKSYTDTRGNDIVWQGIRIKIPISSTEYNYSFLANYVYWYYEKNNEITRSSVGSTKIKSKNAVTVTPISKPVNAWRKFVKLVQGTDVQPNVIVTDYGIGVDYYQGGVETTLYQFIEDINDLVADTYNNFKPTKWVNQNQFNI